MCGIAGYILDSPGPASAESLETLLIPLRPRGPDDEGIVLVSRDTGVSHHLRTDRTAAALSTKLEHFQSGSSGFEHDVALINTRYAVIDRSAAGHQPFTSGDGSVTAVFNGAIYNYVELRSELEQSGVVFRTSSDTEVLVEGYREWHDDVWNRLNGFWAVALYDARTGSVCLSRDRLGVAPLYASRTDNGLFFASTPRPLLAMHPGATAIDRDAVHGFIDTSMKDFDERTVFGPVSSLNPAEVVRFPKAASRMDDAVMQRYWSYPDRSRTVQDLSLDEAATQFRDLLFDAVRIRLRTDLELAFELSGGLDSSSIVAAAAAQGVSVRTYTLEVEGQNEEPYARELCSRYDLDYRVLRDVPAEIPTGLDPFAGIMEEPYHAPNVYTHYALRRAMKEDGADVVLAGSAGDELLAGYDVDFWPRARQELHRSGEWTSAVLCELYTRFQTRARAADAARDLATWIPRRLGAARAGRDPGVAPAYREPGSTDRGTRAAQLRQTWPHLSFHEQRLYHFQRSRLPYYLRMDDRYSMTLPVEHRLPFLDHRLVEFGLQLPATYVFRNGWTKYVLRKAMAPFLPRRVTWRRRKMGFPFAMKPFLARNRDRLEPLLGAVYEAGMVEHDASQYSVLSEAAPYRLWRICSTGAWLRTLDRA